MGNIIQKNLSIRTKVHGEPRNKQLLWLFAQHSNTGLKGRPQAALDFLSCIAGLKKTEETKRILKAAAFSVNRLELSSVPDTSVPDNIKISLSIDEEIWERANDMIRYAFNLIPGGTVQTPFLLKVAGMVFVDQKLRAPQTLCQKEYNEKILLEDFQRVDNNEKLNRIYALLLKISSNLQTSNSSDTSHV